MAEHTHSGRGCGPRGGVPWNLDRTKDVQEAGHCVGSPHGSRLSAAIVIAATHRGHG